MANESESQERDYTTISIPVDLMNKVDKALKKGGYQNRSDFTRDAIRDLLDKIDAKSN